MINGEDATPIPSGAVGFAIYRFKPETQYTPIEFIKRHSSCDIFYRRLKVFGCLSNKNDGTGICDVIDENGDTLESFYLNDKGLRYCYKKLDLRVVHKN